MMKTLIPLLATLACAPPALATDFLYRLDGRTDVFFAVNPGDLTLVVDKDNQEDGPLLRTQEACFLSTSRNAANELREFQIKATLDELGARRLGVKGQGNWLLISSQLIPQPTGRLGSRLVAWQEFALIQVFNKEGKELRRKAFLPTSKDERLVELERLYERFSDPKIQCK